LIDTKGRNFSIVLEDVETLNQNADKKRYQITTLSFAALGIHLGLRYRTFLPGKV